MTVLLKDKPAHAYAGALVIRVGPHQETHTVDGREEIDVFVGGELRGVSVFGTRSVTLEEMIDAVAVVDDFADALERLVREASGPTAAGIDQAKRALARVGRA